jgi:glycosyltransferase involved in cell wall biosynthesis
MRIGLVVPGFSAEPTDWCIPALRHFARALATDADVRVIAIRYPYQAARYSIDSAETIALGGAVRHGASTVGLWRTALDVLRREHRQRPFDVLHAFWATESGLLAALAGRLLHVPTLVSLAGGELVALHDIHYGDQRIAWERLKVAASLRLASGVSTGSHQLASVAKLHLRHKPVYVAPLGVDLELFNAARPSPHAPSHAECPRLVHVGTLTPVKDQVTLLRALAVLGRGGQPATLELLGDGPLRPGLERLAHDLGLAAKVRFCGEVDHACLPRHYQAADALVVSSRHEAQCMAAVEAAACDVPVVGTCVGVVPELTSAVAPVRDPESLARAITRALATSPEVRDASIATVRATFGLHVCADRFRALYAKLGQG